MALGAGPRVGLLHPGEMGAAIGGALAAAGCTVRWASAGRSDETRTRARRAALDDLSTLERLVAESDLILSICPPHGATVLANTVAAAGYTGCYVDANAIAPTTARSIAQTINSASARFVDAAIIGPPPGRGTTRVYLAGADAPEVAAVLACTSDVEHRVLSSRVGDASALKIANSAWMKGRNALLLSARALASIEGVDAALVADWELHHPDLIGLTDTELAAARDKGWRWIGEMEEVAAAFADAGLPDGFHRAAHAIFEQVAAIDAAAPDGPDEGFLGRLGHGANP